MSAIPVSSLLPSDGPLFRLSVEQYHAMIDAGVLTDDDPVELVEGVLVFKMPKKPPHTFVVEAVSEWIRAGLFPGWFFRQQEPITLEDGEPEPDGVIIRGPRQDYRTRHPGPADIALVIEVSDTTLRRDRGMKLRSYARASIQVYWLINLIDRCVEIYTQPGMKESEPTYLHKQVRQENEFISFVLDGKEMPAISVRELLP